MTQRPRRRTTGLGARWYQAFGAAAVVTLVAGFVGTVDGSAASPASAAAALTGAARTGAHATPPVDSSPSSAPPTPAHTAGTPTSQTYPFRPTSLTLPSGTVAPVDVAGVDTAGVLEVPADPSRVGWWSGGALAGEPFGSVVIAGHVDSRTMGLGVMVELFDVAVGAQVVVADATQSRTYRVVSVGAVPKAKLATEFEAFRQDVDHRLVLITCGGAYDHVSHSYPDNVVVVAVPQP